VKQKLGDELWFQLKKLCAANPKEARRLVMVREQEVKKALDVALSTLAVELSSGDKSCSGMNGDH
jgi:hypothetical protein